MYIFGVIVCYSILCSILLYLKYTPFNKGDYTIIVLLHIYNNFIILATTITTNYRHTCSIVSIFMISYGENSKRL